MRRWGSCSPATSPCSRPASGTAAPGSALAARTCKQRHSSDGRLEDRLKEMMDDDDQDNDERRLTEKDDGG